MDRKTKRVFAVANNKGGVGKTTTAANLAYGLSRKLIGEDGKPTGHVLLVDLDPQGNAADALGLRASVYHKEQNPEGACISHLFTGQKNLKDVIVPASHTTAAGTDRPNLFLLPASRALEDTTFDLVLSFVRMTVSGGDAVPINQLLSHYLSGALRVFDFIVVDCPPKLDTMKKAVYEFADEVIVPVQAHYLAAVGARQHIEDVLAATTNGSGVQVSAVVPTVFDGRQVLAREMLKSLRQAYGRQIVADPIPNRVDVKEAPAAGMTVLEYAPDGDSAIAYQKLVDRIYNDVR